MNSLKLAFQEWVYDIDKINDLDKLCKKHNISCSDFVKWIVADPIRKAKWSEFNEAVSIRAIKK